MKHCFGSEFLVVREAPNFPGIVEDGAERAAWGFGTERANVS